MNRYDNRGNRRYDLLGLDLVAEYLHVPSASNLSPDLDTLEEGPQEYCSAVVRNVSLGGICISTEDPHLDVGAEVQLFLAVTDPKPRGQSLSLEFIAEVVWITEDATGYRTGLKFVEVPDGFPQIFQMLIRMLEKSDPVR